MEPVYGRVEEGRPLHGDDLLLLRQQPSDGDDGCDARRGDASVH